MYEYLKSLIRAEGVKPIKQKIKYDFLKNISPHKKYSFGEKNKKINFYVIKRNYNFNGLFSNLIFVVDHIKFARQKNMTPIIDMQNFVTVYNDVNSINRNTNAWNYYFKSLNKYNLNEVYKSKNVYFSHDNRIYKKEINESHSLKRIFNKFININPEHLKFFKKLRNRKFKKNSKILGVHIRGGLEKIVRRHSFPPRPIDILNISKNIFKKKKYDKIFLITEDINYLNVFKNYYKKKLITLNTPRTKSKMFGNHNSHFTDYNRRNHRYRLGREALIDALMLSSADGLLFTTSNLWRFSIIMSKIKQEKYQVKTDTKSSNRLIARWQWYLKYLFPKIFGNINYKVLVIK